MAEIIEFRPKELRVEVTLEEPKVEKQVLTCGTCGGTTFTLYIEDNDYDRLLKLCTECGRKTVMVYYGG